MASDDFQTVAAGTLAGRSDKLPCCAARIFHHNGGFVFNFNVALPSDGTKCLQRGRKAAQPHKKVDLMGYLSHQKPASFFPESSFPRISVEIRFRPVHVGDDPCDPLHFTDETAVRQFLQLYEGFVSTPTIQHSGAYIRMPGATEPQGFQLFRKNPDRLFNQSMDPPFDRPNGHVRMAEMRCADDNHVDAAAGEHRIVV